MLRSGDKVRITAQLIDARSDRHLWSKSFERNSRDVLALQDELASAIAREIHVRLTPEEQSRLTRSASVNPEAYDAYLKGRYFFNRPSDENLSKAIALFEEAIKLDPKFAPAYSGLSDVNLWAGFNEGVLANAEAGPKARAAAEEAIRLDDASAEAHTSLATYRGWYAHDWAGSDAEYRRAFALNPNYSFAHDQYAILLALQGRLDEAVAEGQRAEELDPLSPQIPADALAAYSWQGKFQEAKDLARKAANLDPTYFFPPYMEGWNEIQAGKGERRHSVSGESQGPGVAPFRDRLARLRVRRDGRSDARDGGARRAEGHFPEGPRGLRASLQPRDRPSRSRRPRARPRLPRAGLRQQLAMDALHPGRPDLRSPPLGTPIRSFDEEDGLRK